jgi:hypothetical protein
VAESERGRGNTAAPELARMLFQLRGIDDALIREAIREEQALANLRPIQMLRNLFASAQPR